MIFAHNHGENRWQEEEFSDQNGTSEGNNKKVKQEPIRGQTC